MPSPASEISREDLLAFLRAEGFRVSNHQLLRWHDRGLLPQPRKEGLGRGKGTRSFYPRTAALQARALAKLLADRRSLVDAGWELWVLGFPLTGWARGVLLSDLQAQRAQVARAKKALGPQGALTRRLARTRQSGSLKRMRKAVSAEGMPLVLRMLADFGLGTFVSASYTGEDLEALQDAVLHQLLPSAVNDPELPSVDELRKTLPELSRRISLGRTITALKSASAERLEQYRNEAQWLLELFSPPDERLKEVLGRGEFLSLFKWRHLTPDADRLMGSLMHALGQERPPGSVLQRWQAALSRQIKDDPSKPVSNPEP